MVSNWRRIGIGAGILGIALLANELWNHVKIWDSHYEVNLMHQEMRKACHYEEAKGAYAVFRMVCTQSDDQGNTQACIDAQEACRAVSSQKKSEECKKAQVAYGIADAKLIHDWREFNRNSLIRQIDNLFDS